MRRTVLALVLLLLAGGCLRPAPENVTGPVGRAALVTLYFADHQAQFTVPEDRWIDLSDRALAVRVLEELAAGPRSHGLRLTLPPGTRVLGVEIAGGVARADFSRELVENHPGGSAGEAMTLRSLIFTLTDLEDVEGVTILVEGEAIGLLAGHVELGENMGRAGILAWPVFPDPARAAWLQARAYAGEETWRRDPLEVARSDGRMAGFRRGDAFRLVSRDGSAAVVEATHAGRAYTIRLEQPVKAGPEGIWMITAILDGG